MGQLGGLQVYDRNASIDGVINSSDSQLNSSYSPTIQARSYSLGSQSQSRAAVCQDYGRGEYVGWGAVIGAVVLGLFFGLPGVLIGAVGGGVIGACVDDPSYAKSSLSREKVASLGRTNPKLASLYSRAVEYAKEAVALGHNTEEAVANYVRSKLSSRDGLDGDKLAKLIAECETATDETASEDKETQGDPEEAEAGVKSDYQPEAKTAVASDDESGQEPDDDTPQDADDGDSE